MELLVEGRQWLKEGEPPQAVLQEVNEQLQAASSDPAKAAWKLLGAEANLAAGDAEKAVPMASEALVLFKKLGNHQAEMDATSALVSALMSKDPGAAADVASAAAGVCRDSGDVEGEASMLLYKAKASLASMEDPYAAAEAAIASCLLYRQAGNTTGDAAALEAVARAHLLYDPEQSLKAAKEALAAGSAGDVTALPGIEQLVAAAKVQVATAQNAEQAKYLSCRGQSGAAYKWPKVPQLRGPPAQDVFALQQEPSPQLAMELKESHGGISAGAKDKAAISYSRKAFKWTKGNHKTDEAWFRQELTYLPPPTE